ncbi:3-deoxy-D-manno-octulosonate 8-phosphate phosphatase [Dissulfuribacter thermophilus]|uniref:3-deoxy-D-manno-octulosonate 8-phosphate phosphatase n=1 Tax=Dissulfuribacter thermophilus TaxID=1156395 RepID=A0A1B9F3P0_9BACT|nr:HAD hydrolase family protein [Dissulfuribacter thermophilus]OCC14546.1 3-deoxy-D-manno-octulosonate 8-phosphate phosphatase [Dissulfuribacter thermophilus]
MSHLDKEIIFKKASSIRLLISDVDGVLTDGTIVYTDSGQEIKSFSVLDGLGIKLLMENHVEFSILSSRKSEATSKRARELGIKYCLQGVKNKLEAYNDLKAQMGLHDSEIAYVGDDLVDLPVLRVVGLSITVPNSPPPMKDFVHYVTKRPGGMGAIREVAELILKGKNLWSRVLNKFIYPDE